MKKKISVSSLVRNGIQLVAFFLLPGLFAEAFSGIKALVQGIAQGDFTGVPAALFPTVLLVVITALFGRIFCGYLCAFGTMGDALHWVGKKVFHIKFTVPEKADRVLKYVKYLLFVFLVIVWVTGAGFLSGTSPWDAFGALMTLPPAVSYAFSSLLVGTILLILIMIASLFIERFFCRYLCPMGAVFAVASLLKIATIKKPRRDCGSCRLCTKNCKMGIPLYKTDTVRSGECIACMRCVTPCPRHNARFTVASKDAVPLVASVAAAATVGLYYVGNLGINTLYSGVSSSESSTSSVQSKYADGVYEGSGTGYHNGTTTVSVTISSGKITKITTVSTRDDSSYYNKAYSSVSAAILSAQDSSVSTVSGATYSSKGIMSAVADALAKAEAAQTTSSVASAAASAAADPGTASADTSSENAVQDASSASSSAQVSSSSPASSSSASSQTASVSGTSSAAQSTSAYQDGTYQGSGTGHKNATTTVSVTISGGKITDITTVSTGDDAQWYNRAFSQITSSIISTQSTSVNAVSGATHSSSGIISAVKAALLKAQA